MNDLNISMVSDTQAEACVLASVILHPEYIAHLDFLQPGQFYNVDNGCMYWGVQTLVKNGVTNINALNLSNAINSNSAVRKKVEEFNITNLQEFIEVSQYAACDSLEEVRMLAKTITTMAYKRDLNKVAIKIQRNCFDTTVDLSTLNSLVNSSINELGEKYIVSEEMQSYAEKADSLWDEIVSRRGVDGLAGIPFKFPSLNKYVTLEKTELCAVAARLKRGKSAFLLNQATYALRNGIPTLFCDTEMSDRLFHERLLSNISGVPVQLIKNGKYSDEEEKKLAKASEWIKQQPFYHMYLPEYNLDELYSIHKILKNKMGLELSIFDYIKSNVTSTSENYNVLGALTDFLKNRICGDLDIAMLTAVQLNRNNEVADSDKITRHVSTLLTWDMKTPEEIARDGIACGNYKLRVDVNRLGEQMDETEYIDMNFDGSIMRITEAEPHIRLETPFN